MKDNTVFTKMHLIHHKMAENLNSDLNDMGITKQEFHILIKIFEMNKNNIKVTISSLAQSFNVTLAAIMHRMAELEKNGLVYKEEDQNDKRIKYFYVNDDIKHKCDKIFKKRVVKFKAFKESFGIEKLKKLEEMLDDVIKYLEEEND